MSKIRYKYCIVPYCKSTTIKTPHKIFFSVPVDEQRRKEWCLAIGRVPGKHKTLSVKCSRFVCEDHFDLKKDMDNYMKWKMVGVGKLLLKKGVLPHKLECQRQMRDVKKSDIEPSLLTSHRCGNIDVVRRADSQMYHTVELADVEIRNNKLRGTVLHDMEKENNDANHQDLDIRIKTVVTQGNCLSEQEPKTVVKNEVKDIENYSFSVRYDSDTGGEYLILSHLP